jgi:hypothetical protein
MNNKQSALTIENSVAAAPLEKVPRLVALFELQQ